MKPILITIIISTLFLLFLKSTVGGNTQKDEIIKTHSATQTVEIECAIPVNGMIRGGLPPCDMYPSKNITKKKKYKKPYIVDDVAYKDYHDYSNQRTMKENAERDAYIEYKRKYRLGITEQQKIYRDITQASARAEAAERKAKNVAYLTKKKQTKIYNKKGSDAKSRVVKCTSVAGKVFYSNNCGNDTKQKELRIVKLPTKNGQKRSKLRKQPDKLSSTITYKPRKQ